MAGAAVPGGVRVDGDAKILAFAGVVGFALAVLFWGLAALRLALSGSAYGALAGAAAAASAVFVLLAWGLRTKMEAGARLSRWDVRRLMAAGLVLGLVLGALPYLVLRFKLEDPDFIHLASTPENLPPALR